jgi:hypothetical protein
MPGVLETLVTGIVLRGISAGLATLLMVAPPRKVARAQLKKIYVLNEVGDMAGEYVLDPDCPIDYNDFLKVLPEQGIGDREALFVGEYVFTAFQSDKFVFVLLSRGQLAPEDIDWTALLLTAADSHLAQAAKGTAVPHPAEAKPSADTEKTLAEREARLDAKEKEVMKLEVQVKAEDANLRGRAEELERQKVHLTALADYVSRMQQDVSRGVAKATQSLELAEQSAASRRDETALADATADAEVRRQFDDERKALLLAKEDLEAKYREASERVRQLDAQVNEAALTLERERKETAQREAEAEKMRVAIEARVQELSMRFAQMARERLVNSHRPSDEVSPAAKVELDAGKAELAKERKFLQRRAIELLDREERVRDRELKIEERESAIAKREEELKAKAATLEKMKAAAPAVAPSPDAEEARKDIERRVKIIQQKALELLDREEKLRKRAAELEALEARLSGKVPAE